ncbi:MAG: MFS transporter [Holosporales bacterium]|nr:MFS transporter [Holosporales bacterium]
MSVSSTRSWAAWIVATMFYLYELILRVAPSVMTEGLTESFGTTSTTLGVLVSCYYYSYTILQLPCGIMLDKLGPRNLIGLSALLCVSGTAAVSWANDIGTAQIGRFVIGAGSACAFIGCLQIIADMFPKGYFVILAGITNMMGTVGGLLGGYPVATSVNSIGWRSTMHNLAWLGVIITVLAFIFIPNARGRNQGSTSTNTRERSFITDIASLIKNGQVVLSSIISGFMYLAISAFAELWVVPFFMVKYGINNERASWAAASVFAGVAIGSIIIALQARKLRSYVRVIRGYSLGTAILFFCLILITPQFYQALLCVFGIGFMTGAQVINFTCAKNNTSPEIAGTTVAFANCIVMLIGSIFQPTVGIILDRFWNNTIGEGGVRVYDIACYNKALLVIPAFMIVACIMSCFLKETIHLERE